MKIESKLDLLIKDATLYRAKPDQEFEHFINSPAGQTDGGDYYQQHQQQLQQSDLSFNPLSIQNKIKSAEILNSEPSSEQEILTADAVLNQPDTPARTRYLSELAPLCDSEINDFIGYIKNSMKRQETQWANECVPQSISKDSKKQEIKQTIMDLTAFKNHQLFINNKSAELTLNTSLLSKRQTEALKILVKQWLNNKGIALKQLIINGEYQ